MAIHFSYLFFGLGFTEAGVFMGLFLVEMLGLRHTEAS